jgi:thiamine biosynthesis lipoprotein
MRETRAIMGMPVTVEVADKGAGADVLEHVFSYFVEVDERFSPYKEGSELSRINRGEIGEREWSRDMREIITLAEKTRQETGGYFNIKCPDGTIDPSGIVKGWAIKNAAKLLSCMGYEHFYVDAGGDIQVRGNNKNGTAWSVGIRNPFNRREIVKVIYPQGKGVATSGTYIRGQHIYDPHHPRRALTDVVSITVIGPDVYEADRFATAAFAMGKDGIIFVERLPGFEGFLIDKKGVATMTSDFDRYTKA